MRYKESLRLARRKVEPAAEDRAVCDNVAEAEAKAVLKSVGSAG